MITLKQFVAFVKTQFSADIKVIQSDNGSEFFNSTCTPFFTSLGITRQSSCVDTPQQNGVAERKHRHLFELATLSIVYLPLFCLGNLLMKDSTKLLHLSII